MKRLMPGRSVPIRGVALVLLAAVVFGSSGCAQEAARNEPAADADGASPDAAVPDRLRVAVLSDFPPLDVIIGPGPAEKRSDPDDIQSMVRFLLYTNEFDVEGLVASSATFANFANKQNVLDILDLYDEVDEKLRKHSPDYPTADDLRSVVWQGSSGTWGKDAQDIIGPGRDSEASEQIISLLEDPDPRPIYFGVWGGSCDLAQALWKIRETRTEEATGRLVAKARVYLITLQDGTGQWLLDNFPKLYVIPATTTWQGIFGSKDLDWINANVRNDHGSLGAVYPTVAMGTDPGVKEGDSPSFLYLASAVFGLNDPEHPNQPSWGGRFVRADPELNHWLDAPSSRQTVSRWIEAFDNDFAARMEWCVKDFSEANHAPAVTLAGPRIRDVSPGETVSLQATATDPDGDQLAYQWSQETGVEAASSAVTIANSDSPDQASFVVPDEPGKQVYVIVEVTDDGAPPLVGYQRIIYNIR